MSRITRRHDRCALGLGLALALALSLPPGAARAAARCEPPRAGKLSRCTVDRAAARKAVCNDGSPAIFYLRPGRGAHRDKWVIHLEGGGAGATIPDLWQRWYRQHRRMTSRGAAPHLGGTGLLGPAPPNPFRDWNHVLVKYCSSDVHAGDGEAATLLPPGSVRGDPNPRVWQFRGKRIVRAVLEDLAAGAGGASRLGAATDVLLSGGSAGSVGLVHNLDDMAAYIRGLDPRRTVRVRGVADAGHSPREGLTPLLERRRQAESVRRAAWLEPLVGAAAIPGLLVPRGAALWNSALDATCTAALGRDACADTFKSLPHLETPVFLYMDLIDGKPLERYGVRLPAIKGAEDLQVLVDFATATAAAIGDHLAAHPEDGAFVTFEGYHTALRNVCRFTRLTVRQDGRAHRLHEVLAAWFFGRAGPTVVAQLDPPARLYAQCGRR